MTVFDSRKVMAFSVLLIMSTLVVFGAGAKSSLPAVKSLAFSSSGDSLDVKITSTGEAKLRYFELSRPRRLVVDFQGLQNRIGFKEKAVMTAGVLRVRTSLFQSPSGAATRIVFDLADNAQYRVTQDDGGLVQVAFGSAAETKPVQGSDRAPLNLIAGPPVVPIFSRLTETSPLATVARAATPAQQDPAPVPPVQQDPAPVPPVQQAPAPVPPAQQAPAPATATATLAAPRPTPQIVIGPAGPTTPLPPPPQPAQYTGELISLDLKEVDLKDFFRLIGDISGLNIVLDPNVSGTLTILLKDVPWDQALDVVLKNYQLGPQLQGNVLRIATNGTLQNEENSRRSLRDAQELAAPLEQRMYVLNYTKTAAMAGIMQRMLTS